MKKIEYYQFYQWDGCDRHNKKDPCFFTKEEADAFLGEKSYDYFDKVTVYVYESVDEYLKVEKETTKQKALAKLTDVEKKALGLI